MHAKFEHSEVHWGRTTIPYAIRRSDRRKTVAVTVFPTGHVSITAPIGVTVQRLDRVVHQKAKWITTRLRRVGANKGDAPPKEFVSGETFWYLGRQHRLLVLRGAEWAGMEAGRLVVRTARRSPNHVRAQLLAWYRDRASARLRAKATRWAQRLGLPAPEVLVRDQAMRWGSCSRSGVLRFNWRVIQAPVALIDYVVVHELLHLRHPDHTKAFWAALGAVLPDADARRLALREFGRRVDW